MHTGQAQVTDGNCAAARLRARSAVMVGSQIWDFAKAAEQNEHSEVEVPLPVTVRSGWIIRFLRVLISWIVMSRFKSSCVHEIGLITQGIRLTNSGHVLSSVRLPQSGVQRMLTVSSHAR